MTTPFGSQYPHIRALKVCLACGGGKSEGLLVCWPCHNDLKLIHDDGYGPVMDRVLQVANTLVDKRERDRERSRICDF